MIKDFYLIVEDIHTMLHSDWFVRAHPYHTGEYVRQTPSPAAHSVHTKNPRIQRPPHSAYILHCIWTDPYRIRFDAGCVLVQLMIWRFQSGKQRSRLGKRQRITYQLKNPRNLWRCPKSQNGSGNFRSARRWRKAPLVRSQTHSCIASNTSPIFSIASVLCLNDNRMVVTSE